jgi:hypothetical protein
MNRRNAGLVAVPVVAATAGALALVGPAAQATPHNVAHSAAAAASSSQEHFFLESVNDTHNVYIAHGAFTRSGKDDVSHNNYDVLSFGNGRLRLTHPDSESHFTPHINPTTCYVSFTLTGKYTLGHGTGSYRGVTGHGTYQGHGQGILNRTSSGACDMNGKPKDEVYYIKGSGPVSMP